MIAAAFLTSIPLGIATSLAVIAHEVPQEVGDFAILLNSDYSRTKALLLNGLSSTSTFPGATVRLFPAGRDERSGTAISAASSIYIATR